MFYLVNRFDQLVRTATPSLQDLHLEGFEVVEVPDHVPVDDRVQPFSKAELLDQKFTGVLASEPTFEHIVYDDLADDTQLDLTHVDTRAGGFRSGSVVLPPSDPAVGDGFVQTSSIDISADGSFSKFAVYWDVFQVDTSEVSGKVTRSVTRIDPDTLEVFISHDAGATFKPILFMERVQMATADNRLVLRVTNEWPARYYLASYAILY